MDTVQDLPFVLLLDSEAGESEVGADRVGSDEVNLAIYEKR